MTAAAARPPEAGPAAHPGAYILRMTGPTPPEEVPMRQADWWTLSAWGRWWTSARTGARAN